MADFYFVPVAGLVCTDPFLHGILGDYDGEDAVIEYVGPDYFILRPDRNRKITPRLIYKEQYRLIKEGDFI